MPLWDEMNATPRRLAAAVSALDIPVGPGVYAFYEDGRAVYVGKATSLRSRLWRNHLRTGASMTNSAFRRNVAAALGVATAADIKARRYQPTTLDARKVKDWIMATEVAWLTAGSPAEAARLEAALKLEYKPPLTRL